MKAAKCLTLMLAVPLLVQQQGASVAVERTLTIAGACPTLVNPSSKGVTRMLLVGDATFAVSAVVLDSLELRRCDGEGGAATPLNNSFKFKNLNGPLGGSVNCDGCACNPPPPDNFGDLSMEFRTDTTLAALGIATGGEFITLELTGTLNDGSAFFARDCILVVP